MNTHIQANNPDCFNSCAQPHNATSTCWIQCVVARAPFCCRSGRRGRRRALTPLPPPPSLLSSPGSGASTTRCSARAATRARWCPAQALRSTRSSTTLISPFKPAVQKRAAVRTFETLSAAGRLPLRVARLLPPPPSLRMPAAGLAGGPALNKQRHVSLHLRSAQAASLPSVAFFSRSLSSAFCRSSLGTLGLSCRARR